MTNVNVEVKETPEEMKVVKWNELQTEDKKFLDLEMEVANETINVTTFMNRLSVFVFNDKLQRNFVWTLQKKSLAVLSMLQRVALGAVKAQIIRRGSKKIRNIIDGKQRLLTIRDFYNNKFKLKGLPLVQIELNGELVLLDLNGASFSDLPEVLQNRFKETDIVIEQYEVNDEVKAQLFYRWNNGEMLKPAEKRLASMPIIVSDKLVELKNKEVIKNVLTPTAVDRNAHSDMVIQITILSETEGTGNISTSGIDAFLSKLDAELIDKVTPQIELLEEAYESISLDDRTELLNKTKVISLGYASKVARELGITAEQYGEWIVKFFNYAPQGKKFNELSQSSTTKPAIVKERNELVVNALKEAFKNNTAEVEVEVEVEEAV